jgi:uncharacterized protein with GYD domain
MPTYISLVQFTDKGLQAAKETNPASGRLSRQGRAAWSKHQADVLDAGSTTIRYASSRPRTTRTVASVLLAAEMLGNIRTQTWRAFTTSEMEKILTNVV